MKNNKILVLTKTNWNEPPRIRHQITNMVKNSGYEIHYFEKNSYKGIIPKFKSEDGMYFYRHAELIHHQLRYFRVIQKMNNWIVSKYIKHIIGKKQFDCVLNFNYEYDFLKKMFPNTPVISIMEDDFELQAKWGMSKNIRDQVGSTCKNSDYVLTVSYFLYDKLAKHKDNVKLFFPWSQNEYINPLNSDSRNTVLYFGYVGRLNWDMVEELLKKTNYKYRFVGPPIRSSDEKWINKLIKNHNNFEYIPFSKLEELKTDDAFCSILPYDDNLGNVQGCSISNRAFNLLSKGLPLVYANLPYIIKSPKTVIRTNSNLEEYISSLEFFHKNFYDVQPDIKSFLEENYEDKRKEILLSLFN